MNTYSRFASERKAFHDILTDNILFIRNNGSATNADAHNNASVMIAQAIALKIGAKNYEKKIPAQTLGSLFEEYCANFIRNTFSSLKHLRPGQWSIEHITGRDRLEIARFSQYSHLVALDKAAKENPELAAAIGSDYTIIPDVIVTRMPEEDSTINTHDYIVDDSVSKLTWLRKKNNNYPILHASISCKWTIRSDRAQNSRSEALNLIRNRKGQLPHIMVVTAEPTPNRLASLALGTGDIDCVYHFALHELISTVEKLKLDDSRELLDIMIKGDRLKDISDLPFDLAT